MRLPTLGVLLDGYFSYNYFLHLYWIGWDYPYFPGYGSSVTGFSLEHLKISLDLFVSSNLEDREGLAIDYEGLPFNNIEYTSWIQPRIIQIIYDQPPRSEMNTAEFPGNAQVYFSIIIYSKKSNIIYSDEHYSIRDAIHQYFKTGDTYERDGDKFKIRDIEIDKPQQDEEFLYYRLNYEIMFSRI